MVDVVGETSGVDLEGIARDSGASVSGVEIETD